MRDIRVDDPNDDPTLGWMPDGFPADGRADWFRWFSALIRRQHDGMFWARLRFDSRPHSSTPKSRRHIRRSPNSWGLPRYSRRYNGSSTDSYASETCFTDQDDGLARSCSFIKQNSCDGHFYRCHGSFW